jgi:hypothetical protein
MWTVRNHWKKVIFSDETKIEIGNNRKVYVWRKVDERLRSECNGLYQGRNYKTKFSVMFWGWMISHCPHQFWSTKLFSFLSVDRWNRSFLTNWMFFVSFKVQTPPNCFKTLIAYKMTKFSVMFWGCISYYGIGTLTPVVGNLNSEKYINILDDNLWTVIAQHFPTSPYIFQVDNALCAKHKLSCYFQSQSSSHYWK